MTREEPPRLYDALIRLSKDTKRISRRRILAHDGLLFQVGVAGQVLAGEGGLPPWDVRHGQLTNQIFENRCRSEMSTLRIVDPGRYCDGT